MNLSAISGFPQAIRSRFFRKSAERSSATIESLENRTLLTGYINHLVFERAPVNEMAGAIVIPPIVVDIENRSGNIVLGDESPVTLTLSSGAFGGTSTVNAINGVAAFSTLTIPNPGAYTITATDGADKPITSIAFAATPALHVAFIQQPIDAIARGPIAPVIVAVEDPNGNIVSTPAETEGNITVASSDGSQVASARVVAGEATFSTLSLANAGSYTLTATAGRDASAVSNTFNVTPASPAPLTLAPKVIASTVPAAIVVGASLRGGVAVELTNDTQSLMSGPFTLNLFASTDGAVDGSAIPLVMFVHNINLKPGKTAVVRLPVKPSAPLVQGTYTLLAQTIDPSGNTSTAPFGPWLRVQPPTVQLQDAVGPLTPKTLHPNGVGIVSVLVTNEGNAAFNDIATFNVGLSTDAFTEETSIDTFQRHLHIQAGKSIILTLTLNVGPTPTPGTYFPFISITESGITAPAAGPTSFVIVG